MSADAIKGFCDSSVTPDGFITVSLRCDYKEGHGGLYHKEKYVARWKRDGSELRWFNPATDKYDEEDA